MPQYYADFGENGGIQAVSRDELNNPPESLLEKNADGSFRRAGTADTTSPPPAPGVNTDYLRWNGQAGSPVYYKNAAGAWINGGAPEHSESASYVQRAANDPQVQRLFEINGTNPGALNNEQKSFIWNPMLGMDSFGQGTRWGALDLYDDKFNAQQAGGLMLSGGSQYLSDADKAAGGQFIQDESPAAQSARDDSGGFGDFLPVLVLAGIGIATGGFGLMGAAAEGAALTGIEAGVMTAAEAAAAETAAMSAWAAAPASGMMESVLTNAAIGAGTSAIRGGDPLVGAITGGIGGAISASGALSDISGGLISSTGAEGAAATAITKGVNAAATGAVGAAINGGSFEDVLASGVTSGLTSAAGNYVSGELRADGSSGTIAGAAGGATAGLTNAVLTGGDIATGLITSGAAGAAAGAASDLGAGPATAGAVGSVVGSVVGSELAPEPMTPPPVTTTTTPPPAAADSGDLSWGDLTLNYVTQPRADMAWGTRLAGRV